MDPRQLKFVLIIASIRPGRLGPAVAEWFLEQAQRFELDIDIDIDIEMIDLAEPTGTHTTQVLGSSDGFVVVTPEYNHSYPGDLKILIDAHRVEWKHKPVTFVSYGGMSGGGVLTLDESAIGSARGALAELVWWAELLKPARQAHDRGVA